MGGGGAWGRTDDGGLWGFWGLQAVVEASSRRIVSLAAQWERHRGPLLTEFRQLRALRDSAQVWGGGSLGVSYGFGVCPSFGLGVDFQGFRSRFPAGLGALFISVPGDSGSPLGWVLGSVSPLWSQFLGSLGLP